MAGMGRRFGKALVLPESAAAAAERATSADPKQHVPETMHVIWDGVEFSSSSQTKSASSEGTAGLTRRSRSLQNVEFRCNSEEASSQSFSGPGRQSEGENDGGEGEGPDAEEAEALQAELGELPSVGSTGHEAGTCKPCLLVRSSLGCRNGASCAFCHFWHTRRDRPRPSKGKRQRQRRLLDRVQVETQEDEGEARRRNLVSL